VNGTIFFLKVALPKAGADVHFANLGLVIVDEEQRFGVGVKERLKALRVSVDGLC